MRIKSGEAFFLDAEPSAKVGTFAECKRGLAQDIQVQRRHILPSLVGVLVKNDVQGQVQLFFIAQWLRTARTKRFMSVTELMK